MLEIIIIGAAFAMLAVWFTYRTRVFGRRDQDLLFSLSALGAVVAGVGTAVAVVEVISRLFLR